MHIIEELAAYFSELLTFEQEMAVAEICGLPPQEKLIDPGEDDYDARGLSDEYDESDEYPEYDLPPDRRKGHAAGKRRPLRRPAVSAAGLVRIFREMARRQWKEVPVSLDILSALAQVHDPNYLQGGSPRNKWRRFLAAVACLKDLDEDALADDIRRLLEQQIRAVPVGILFRDWFISWKRERFERLADDFCRRKIEGSAPRAVLRALQSITRSGSGAPAGDVSSYRPFLENPELVAIFDYYRVLWKVQRLLKASAYEAALRAVRRSY